jgi:hypothetical protein
MYELFRSLVDKELYLVCRSGQLEKLPEAVSLRGPWQLVRTGQAIRLKRDYRNSLERFGYVLKVSKSPPRLEQNRGSSERLP